VLLNFKSFENIGQLNRIRLKLVLIGNLLDDHASYAA